MARKPQPGNRRASGPSAGGGRRLSLAPIWLAIILLLVMYLSMPTVILLAFGLIPSVVAYIIDRTPQKNATYCVASLNIAGVFPFLMKLWGGSREVGTVIDILTDVFSLLLIYGAAAFGWMVYMSVPPVIAAFRAVMDQHRLTQLKDIQRQLVEEWGEEVSASATEPPSTRPTRRRST